MTFENLFSQLAVFPLRPIVRTPSGRLACTCSSGTSCKRIGKHPDYSWSKVGVAEKRWHNYQDRIVDDAGYGICTGFRSGIFVIDLDGPAAILALARLGPVPRTLLVCRGSDRGHLYFTAPGFKVRTNAGIIAPGIDVRGDGGFVVGPGSPHKSGMLYELADDVEVADAPNWLLSHPGVCGGCDNAPGAPPVPVVAGSTQEAERIDEAIEYLKTARGAVSGEKGHTTFWIVAQTLVRTIELSEATAYALITAHYNPRCEPPWSKREIQHKLVQAAKCGHFETRSEVDAFNARLLAAENRRSI